MYLLQADPSVIRFQSRAHVAHYVLNGKPTSHVVAFIVQAEAATYAVDIIDTRQRPKARYCDIDLLTTAYGQLGIDYRCLDDRFVHLEPRFKNAVELNRWKSAALNLASELSVIEAISNGADTVGKVIQAIGATEVAGLAHVYGLALKGKLRLSMGQPLSANTSVCLVTGKKAL
ncbi:hypothetical protein [Nitrospirillum viridazoti]|uniref:TnsA endonuclease N-terminal domain-containing protein n=1 Tax=Nitrospirillum viridazoti CBAmc TaxID=1441467 RepID=A0A248JWW6_9PROT|nr:hypothetical protein [Nitrospirillum amazonense]ASG23217.1 hypothetical protein Y958_20515 [Nitrospirillum amazonense CBAmc]TWB38975.1 hypothetical protein FBZ91_106308 [Nitrospirillum amazonense]